MEKWKVVEGYPYYEVSDRGRVRSLPRRALCGGGGMRSVVGGILKLCKGPGGYPWVSLFSGGRRQTFMVHRLVLDAFRGPKPAPGMVCRHLDGTKTNNLLSNLVWGTHQENMDDMRRHGTEVMGENHPLAKMTDKRVIKCRRLFATGNYTLTALAVWCGVSAPSMHHIIHRKSWKHIK